MRLLFFRASADHSARKNPFPGHPGAGNSFGLDERVHLLFMDAQMLGDLFGIHEFFKHGFPPFGGLGILTTFSVD